MSREPKNKPLLHSLCFDSRLEPMPWILKVLDYSLCAQVNPFLFNSLLVNMFYHSNRKANENSAAYVFVGPSYKYNIFLTHLTSSFVFDLPLKKSSSCICITFAFITFIHGRTPKLVSFSQYWDRSNSEHGCADV